MTKPRPIPNKSTRIARARGRQWAKEQVLALIEEGFDLRAIAAEDGLPRLETLERWLASDGALSEAYARAEEARFDRFIDDTIALADANTGNRPADIKLRIDTRKWCVAMMRERLRDSEAAAEPKAKDTGPSELVLRLREEEARIKREAELRREEERKAAAAEDALTESPPRDGGWG